MSQAPKTILHQNVGTFNKLHNKQTKALGFVFVFVLAHEQPFSKTEIMLETKFMFLVIWCQARKDDLHQARQINQYT